MLELNKVYCGDCLEVMKDIDDNSIDAIVTDPPYNTTHLEWDEKMNFVLLWKHYKRIIKKNGVIAIFGQEPFSSYLRLSNIDWYKYDWYWEKERLTNVLQVKRRPGKTIETISVFYSTQCKYFPQKQKHYGNLVKNKVKNGKLGNLVDKQVKDVIPYEDDRFRYPTQILKFKRDILKSNLHPTQKPEALIEYLVKTYTNKNDLILDSFIGSGTIGVSCKKLKRNFIGIEQDEKYCEIAIHRINAVQPNLI